MCQLWSSENSILIIEEELKLEPGAGYIMGGIYKLSGGKKII